MVITPPPPHYYYHVSVYCRSIHFFWVFFWHDDSVCSNGVCEEICRRVTSSQPTILQNIDNILVNLFSCSNFVCGSSLIFHRFSLILASKTVTFRFQASELYRTKVWYTNTFAVFLISSVCLFSRFLAAGGLSVLRNDPSWTQVLHTVPPVCSLT